MQKGKGEPDIETGESGKFCKTIPYQMFEFRYKRRNLVGHSAS